MSSQDQEEAKSISKYNTTHLACDPVGIITDQIAG